MIVVGDHEKMKKKSNILEMVNCTTKQWEMWDSMILAEYIWGYFHLVVFNVIWGHLVHLQCFKKRFSKRHCFYSDGSSFSQTFHSFFLS